jgi:hypothetical protein
MQVANGIFEKKSPLCRRHSRHRARDPVGLNPRLSLAFVDAYGKRVADFYVPSGVDALQIGGRGRKDCCVTNDQKDHDRNKSAGLSRRIGPMGGIVETVMFNQSFDNRKWIHSRLCSGLTTGRFRCGFLNASMQCSVAKLPWLVG